MNDYRPAMPEKPIVDGEPIVGGNSVGRTIPHDSAVGHVTGAAPYIDDLPRRVDELFVDFVGSPVACGKVVSLETEQAKALSGVVAVFTHKDVGNHNVFGPLFCDEPFLAAEEVLVCRAAGGADRCGERKRFGRSEIASQSERGRNASGAGIGGRD